MSDNKKYIWKLAYAHLLGYNVDFGYKQILDLQKSKKYSEKYTGYKSCSILVQDEDNDNYTTASVQIRNDLYSKNQSV